MTAPVIAVLDNDPSFLSLMHELLTDAGYRTLRCRPGDVVSAHALVKRVRPALVILDLWLEQRDDGWSFLTQMWDDSETAHIPALIVTGEKVSQPVHVEVLHARRCPILKKPFDLQDMLTEIAVVLGPSPVQWDRGPHLHAVPPADLAVPDLSDYPLVAAEGAL
jgi:DNA-binding response OmpR family regulator